MSFNPNIPQPTDLLSNSQPQLLTNFGVLNTAFGVNHTPFATATNSGKHTFVEMPILASPPPSTLINEGSLYTQSDSQSPVRSQLYYTNDASTNQYQLTRCIDGSFSSFGANPGWTFLPGGLILQYGMVTSGSTGTVTTPITYTNTIYAVWTQVFGNGATPGGTGIIAINQSNLSTNTFNWIFVSKSSAYTGFWWWTIGK